MFADTLFFFDAICRVFEWEEDIGCMAVMVVDVLAFGVTFLNVNLMS